MCLKFGLYLVEQGIISCDQFCGLVKIQQTAVPSPGSIAIKRNFMSVKQVAQVLDTVELNPGSSFLNTAHKLDYLDSADIQSLEREQQLELPTINKLVVECGLMTQSQMEALYRAFEKSKDAPYTAPVATVSVRQHPPQRSETVRQPKFKQRPVVSQYAESFE